MRIARFAGPDGCIRYGRVTDADVIPLAINAADPDGLIAWLAQGLGTGGADDGPPFRLDDVAILAPISAPPKFLGIGGNYRSHLDEIAHLGVPAPATQLWFNKQRTCVAGPFDDVLIPPESEQIDYEGELAVVIGRRCRRTHASEALGMVAGYLVCNDVSARDVQLRSPTMTLGKSFDTHGPIGPWLVTPDEIEDPQALGIRVWVNGELRQQGHTGEMTWTVAEQIAELSGIFTLEPGDILATGTPSGVGAARRPPAFLRDQDVVRVQIDRIGEIRNRFVAETPTAARQE